jgi:glutamate racemase
MKLGIFDSGIGGEAIAQALQKAFPQAVITTINDKEHLPYGDKSHDQIVTLTHLAIQPLLNGSYDCVIIACNSATTVALDILRARYPAQKFIGIEPMVKPAAALSKTGVVGVCATPATLKSARYQNLREAYGKNTTFLEPDCQKWASMIERNHINEAAIKKTVQSLCQQKADVIVLGCTHYHWIKEMIVTFARGKAVIMEPSEAISKRVAQLLELR